MVGNFGKLFNNLDFCEDGVNTRNQQMATRRSPWRAADRKGTGSGTQSGEPAGI
jgi:hypothetical protein